MPEVKCKICSKEFYIKPSHQSYGWGKYCSRDCVFKSQFNGKFFQCFTCGKVIYRSLKAIQKSRSGKYFCDKSCQTLWRNEVYPDENSQNWKSGEKAYRSILKKSGIERVCYICGINDEKILSAHHKDHNRQNNRVENLIWLCLNCHYLVHHDQELDKKIKKA